MYISNPVVTWVIMVKLIGTLYQNRSLKSRKGLVGLWAVDRNERDIRQGGAGRLIRMHFMCLQLQIKN